MAHDDGEICRLATRLLSKLAAAGQRVATAESCTGGWVAKSLTDIPGSSDAFGYGWVTYSNEAKVRLLGLDPKVVENHGAVSEPVVAAMAAAALKRSGADYALAISGVAGPDGGSDDKPVGTVWLAWARHEKDATTTVTRVHGFEGDRDAVRRQSVVVALRGVLDMVGS